MTGTHYHLFETALGRCGIAWEEKGILSVSFPEETDALTVKRLRRHASGAEEADTLPGWVETAIADIQKLAEGGQPTLEDVPLVMEGLDGFDRELYCLSRKIPPGETRTYGDLAILLGDVAHSRRVGQSLGRNPFPIIVPCHRVVGAGGTMTGFSAPGGVETKRQLLKIEGAIGPDLFDLMDAG